MTTSKGGRLHEIRYSLKKEIPTMAKIVILFLVMKITFGPSTLYESIYNL